MSVTSTATRSPAARIARCTREYVSGYTATLRSSAPSSAQSRTNCFSVDRTLLMFFSSISYPSGGPRRASGKPGPG